jgi:hypothetical protein
MASEMVVGLPLRSVLPQLLVRKCGGGLEVGVGGGTCAP